MKKELKNLAIFISGCLLAYLVGSFYSVSFDISAWTIGTRWWISLLFLAFGFIAGIYNTTRDL